MTADFSGYATKVGLKCSDGRTIMPNAFEGNDGAKVPLVWQHSHNEPSNVLGHAMLENREDGVYAYGFFNDTPAAQQAKALVQHGDISALSIYANNLVEKSKQVMHGVIREVSLVLSGANPGALIDNVTIRHSDGDIDVLDDEAVIYTGEVLMHGDSLYHEDDADDNERTIEDIYNEMTEEQRDVVNYLVGLAATSDPDDVPDEDFDDEEDVEHDGLDGGYMTHNVFENQGAASAGRPTLSHSQIEEIMDDAKKSGSLKEAFLAHAEKYGIGNIDILFPDAKTLRNAPDFVQRRNEWVSTVLSGTQHSPFNRIKSIAADITQDEARAKGYIKGKMKKEEFFELTKRITTPTTIYKKQKLDRDDIIDITDLDVVAWLKAEMRMMLDEELARAILIGDGREVDHDDKINEKNIRPIAKDNSFYTHRVTVASDVAPDVLEDNILRSRKFYKGTGTPTFFTTEDVLSDLLLQKDKMGRRIYSSQTELESALRVAKIVPCEVLEATPELLGIMVNLTDYTVGATRGGEVSMFDDFDIDYNQYKYLMETRCCGTLTRPKSAVAFWKQKGTKATPTKPTVANNVITIPTAAGVDYTVEGAKVTGTVTMSSDTMVVAVPQKNYFFETGTVDNWFFNFVPTER